MHEIQTKVLYMYLYMYIYTGRGGVIISYIVALTLCCGKRKHRHFVRLYLTSSLIDGLDGACFWVISVVPTAAVSRHGRTRVIFHVYIAQFYLQHGGGNIVLSNDVIVAHHP